jgi:hypothetical protein
MRTLSPRPEALLDRSTRKLRTGSFQGGLAPRIDPSKLGNGRLFRATHEKRWVYTAIAADDLLIGAAVVRLGYASNTFVFAFDRAAGRMLVDRTAMGHAGAAKVGEAPAEGLSARYRLLASHVAVERAAGEQALRFTIEVPELRVDARLSTEGIPPPIGAVAVIPGPPSHLWNATEKQVLLPVTGEAVIAGKRRSLDGAVGGYDYTYGWLARRTAWRWAFALGRAKSGERVALNLVQGFVGEPECALWIGDDLVPLSEGRFEFDREKPLAPWYVRTAGGEVDLRFDPGGVHEENRDYAVVASRFIQPAGGFSGTITVPGRAPVELDRVLGVVEDQEVRW